MDVTQTTTAAAAATTTAQPKAANAAISSDFETFLKMLTTQLQNQDPLNPIEGSDYAVQLATFSGVEQQVKTNQLLEAMAADYGAMGMSQLAGWVGMEARAVAPVAFDGTPVTVIPKVAADADRAVMVVRNSQGAEMQTLNIGTNEEPMSWAGVSANGTPLPSDTYTFHIRSYSGDDLVGTEQAEVYARISEAQVSGARTVLVLEGGAQVTADQITALREPK